MSAHSLRFPSIKEGRSQRNKAAHILAGRKQKENTAGNGLPAFLLFPSRSSAYGVVLPTFRAGLPTWEVLLGNTLTDTLRGESSFLKSTKLTVKIHHCRVTAEALTGIHGGGGTPAEHCTTL